MYTPHPSRDQACVKQMHLEPSAVGLVYHIWTEHVLENLEFVCGGSLV